MLLINTVEGILEKGGFNYCTYDGCFDIAARRNFTLFLKVLDNVDSFQEKQANNLKIISEDIEATVALVGTHTRRENLRDNIVYDRFEIPTFTPNTLESIVVNDTAPTLYRFRGGLFSEIDSVMLRKMRESAGLSQTQLADIAGVTKKNIYEHEKQDKNASLRVVERIEKAIGVVRKTVGIEKTYTFEKNRPVDGFEKLVSQDLRKIGFSTDLVSQTPFNIVAREKKILVISKADQRRKRMEKDLPFVSQLSSVTHVPAVAITKEEVRTNMPTIPEKELREMRSAKDIRKFIK